jgi:hypothetical protein
MTESLPARYGMSEPRGTYWRSVLRILLLMFMIGQVRTSFAASAGEELTAFRANRAAFAADLARQVASCVVRRDTWHPAFHGCVDWHSATHGTWALSAYSRLTGDKQYDHLVAAILSEDNLRAEQRYLADHPGFEMPYGRAWFLRLAVERNKIRPDPVIDAMAEQVAQSLMDYIRGKRVVVLSQEYDSDSWALVNLLDYANHYRNEDIEKFVKMTVRDSYLTFGGVCPFEKEGREWTGFMAVCTTAAWLVSDAVPAAEFPAEFNEWLSHFLPATTVFSPVAAPNSDHQAGLDFSRSWGFWKLYRRTGDPRYLDAFIAHFNENMSHRDRWAGEYYRVGHWVAQFGMLAIALTFDDATQ